MKKIIIATAFIFSTLLVKANNGTPVSAAVNKTVSDKRDLGSGDDKRDLGSGDAKLAMNAVSDKRDLGSGDDKRDLGSGDAKLV